MNEYDWYSLDNAAKIFPAISGNQTSSVFRVDARLKKAVDPAVLEKAVNSALPFFPAFKMRMRKGLFWYYLEHNFESVLISEENACPCSRIDADSNAGYLFRFSYYRNKINLDVYHVLSDGVGAVNFLIAVISCYLTLCGEPVEAFIPGFESFKFSAMEDSFSKFCSGGSVQKPKKTRAYHIKGTPRSRGDIKIIHGVLQTEGLLRLAKSKNVSLTSYLAAVLAYSIIKTHPGYRPYPLRLHIPVNLRRFFESQTQRNFFTFVTADIDFEDRTFDGLLQLVAGQMTERLRPEYFMPQIKYFIEAEKNIFARLTPLFIKNLALRFIYRYSGDETFTCSLSNLGRLSVSAALAPYIERFDCMLGVSKKNRMNCGVCSFNDQTVVSFTKSDYDTDVERAFFRFLSAQGLKIILEQN